MPLKDLEKRREYHREYMRGWYQENKSKHIALVRSREKRIKQWLREYKETLGCEVCSETHPACLEFHHIDPCEKKFSVGRIKCLLSIRAVQCEIEKCRLLCANCHRKIHWNERRDKSQNKLLSKAKRITVNETSRRNPFLPVK